MARKKTFKIGIFGANRGRTFIKQFRLMDNVEVVAICEKNQETIDKAKEFMDEKTLIFDNFDDFIKVDMDALVLTNNYNEHAKYAIKGIEFKAKEKKKLHILSDTTAAPTLAECVQLCRTIEKHKCKYMLAANTSWMPGPAELKQICQRGDIGDVMYGEAEYLHPWKTEPCGFNNRKRSAYTHWRDYIPRTYYNMHSLGALMEITNSYPVKVTGKAVFAPAFSEAMSKPYTGDVSSITTTEMSNGAVFTTTGHSSLGPVAKWFRLSGTKGNAETLRFDETGVRVDYMEYAVPENDPEVEGNHKVYYPKHAGQCGIFTKKEINRYVPPEKPTGHAGGCDLWIATYFIKYLKNEVKPFFDIYNATALSAAGILAWKSVLNGCKEYDVPNFRDKRRRRKFEKDYSSPFPDENGNRDMPSSSKEYNLFDKYGIE